MIVHIKCNDGSKSCFGIEDVCSVEYSKEFCADEEGGFTRLKMFGNYEIIVPDSCFENFYEVFVSEWVKYRGEEEAITLEAEETKASSGQCAPYDLPTLEEVLENIKCIVNKGISVNQQTKENAKSRIR